MATLSPGVVPEYRLLLPHYWTALAGEPRAHIRERGAFTTHLDQRNPLPVLGLHDGGQDASRRRELKQQFPDFKDSQIDILLYQEDQQAHSHAAEEKERLSVMLRNRTDKHEARVLHACSVPSLKDANGNDVGLTPSVRNWLQEFRPDVLAKWQTSIVTAVGLRPHGKQRRIGGDVTTSGAAGESPGSTGLTPTTTRRRSQRISAGGSNSRILISADGSSAEVSPRAPLPASGKVPWAAAEDLVGGAAASPSEGRPVTSGGSVVDAVDWEYDARRAAMEKRDAATNRRLQHFERCTTEDREAAKARQEEQLAAKNAKIFKLKEQDMTSRLGLEAELKAKLDEAAEHRQLATQERTSRHREKQRVQEANIERMAMEKAAKLEQSGDLLRQSMAHRLCRVERRREETLDMTLRERQRDDENLSRRLREEQTRWQAKLAESVKREAEKQQKAAAWKAATRDENIDCGEATRQAELERARRLDESGKALLAQSSVLAAKSVEKVDLVAHRKVLLLASQGYLRHVADNMHELMNEYRGLVHSSASYRRIEKLHQQKQSETRARQETRPVVQPPSSPRAVRFTEAAGAARWSPAVTEEEHGGGQGDPSSGTAHQEASSSSPRQRSPKHLAAAGHDLRKPLNATTHRKQPGEHVADAAGRESDHHRDPPKYLQSPKRGATDWAQLESKQAAADARRREMNQERASLGTAHDEKVLEVRKTAWELQVAHAKEREERLASKMERHEAAREWHQRAAARSPSSSSKRPAMPNSRVVWGSIEADEGADRKNEKSLLPDGGGGANSVSRTMSMSHQEGGGPLTARVPRPPPQAVDPTGLRGGPREQQVPATARRGVVQEAPRDRSAPSRHPNDEEIGAARQKREIYTERADAARHRAEDARIARRAQLQEGQAVALQTAMLNRQELSEERRRAMDAADARRIESEQQHMSKLVADLTGGVKERAAQLKRSQDVAKNRRDAKLLEVSEQARMKNATVFLTASRQKSALVEQQEMLDPARALWERKERLAKRYNVQEE